MRGKQKSVRNLKKQLLLSAMKVFPETEYKNNSEMAEKAPGKDSTKESKKATTKKGIKATAKKISKDSTVKKAPKVKNS